MLMKSDLPKRFKLRRMGGSLYITVPKEYVDDHDLDVHDDGLWLPTPDGVLLKFAKVQADSTAEQEAA